MDTSNANFLFPPILVFGPDWNAVNNEKGSERILIDENSIWSFAMEKSFICQMQLKFILHLNAKFVKRFVDAAGWALRSHIVEVAEGSLKAKHCKTSFN